MVAIERKFYIRIVSVADCAACHYRASTDEDKERDFTLLTGIALGISHNTFVLCEPHAVGLKDRLERIATHVHVHVGEEGEAN